MGAQIRIAARQILPGILVQVAEGRREAVGAMVVRDTAQGPQRVLQALGQSREALAAEHHMSVLEAAPDEPKMIEPVIERLPCNGDGEWPHVGEIRQSHTSGLVFLPEDDLLFGTMNGAPLPDAPLQCTANAV